MNALLCKERAIVTEIPGTTRDLLEEDLTIGNLHFRLTDTAGIRKTDERIEQEGIRRSKQAMKEADLVLLVFDATQPFTEKEQELLAQAPTEKTLVVWNKIDLLQEMLYPNNLKNREFGKEAPQNFCSERATIAERQGASKNKNSEIKPTPPKTNSSSCLGIDSKPGVHISAKERYGLSDLQTAIEQIIWKGGLPSKEEIVITNQRHQQALQRALSFAMR